MSIISKSSLYQQIYSQNHAGLNCIVVRFAIVTIHIVFILVFLLTIDWSQIAIYNHPNAKELFYANLVMSQELSQDIGMELFQHFLFI